MKILFLGYTDCKVLDFLKSEGNKISSLGPKEPVTLEFIKEKKPDMIISFGYRKIIKPEIIKAYPKKIINLHTSYLPWNRGCYPNFWSHLENTPKGYSILYVNEGIDTGDILLREKIALTDEETLATSYDKIMIGMESLFIKNWNKIKSGGIKAEPQDLKEGNYHFLNEIDKHRIVIEDLGWGTKISDIAKYGKKNKLWIFRKKA
ncbi:MAG: formyltransferase family protein [Candidatus Paceibacterota bacterium]|jgi:methionyl-tRNA formyltransferase